MVDLRTSPQEEPPAGRPLTKHFEETRKTRKAKFDATAVSGLNVRMLEATIAVIACYAGEGGSRTLRPPITNRGNAEPLNLNQPQRGAT
jgi:hypothetical protein